MPVFSMNLGQHLFSMNLGQHLYLNILQEEIQWLQSLAETLILISLGFGQSNFKI